MAHPDSNQDPSAVHGEETGASNSIGYWLQDPFRSVVVASATCMSSLGIVLGGSWFINLALT